MQGRNCNVRRTKAKAAVATQDSSGRGLALVALLVATFALIAAHKRRSVPTIHDLAALSSATTTESAAPVCRYAGITKICDGTTRAKAKRTSASGL